MQQKLVLGAALGLLLIAAGAAAMGTFTERAAPRTEDTTETHTIADASSGFGAGHSVTLYKSPTCGCCEGYAQALRDEGFAVDVRSTRDLRTIKEEHQIPLAGESCHTSIIGDYVVEGHVPLAAVAKLLEEAPDVAGIGLPSMPLGTPGMPGPKAAPYEVYQLSAEGEMSPYLSI